MGGALRGDGFLEVLSCIFLLTSYFLTRPQTRVGGLIIIYLYCVLSIV